MRFHRVKAPTIEELSSLVHQLSHRVTRVLEKKGWLQRDDENTYLLLDAIDQEDDALGQLQGHSITYRIAMGPQKGRKVFTLQSLPPRLDTPRVSDRVAKQAGFSLHAGVLQYIIFVKHRHRNFPFVVAGTQSTEDEQGAGEA